MNRKTLLWTILILLHTLAFGYQAVNPMVYLTDSKGYLQEAENIRQHFVFYCFPLSDPTDLRAYSLRPPLYPLFLTGLKMIWNSDLFVLICQNLLSLVNFSLVFRLLKPERLSRKQFLYLIPAIVFFPAQALYANLIMAEILLQTLLLLFFLAAKRYFLTRENRFVWLAAFCLALAILTKPVMLFFVLIFLAATGYFAYREKQPGLVAAGLLPILVILGFSWRNQHVTGHFHYSSIKEVNLLYYNTALLLQNQHGLPYSDSVIASIEKQAALEPTFKQQQEYINAACNRIVLDNLPAYLKFHLKGVVHFFADPGRFDLYSFFRLQDTKTEGLLSIYNSKGYAGILEYLKVQPVMLLFYLLLIFLFNLVRLALFGLYSWRYFRTGLAPLLLIGLVLYIALITGPLGASRFLVPVFPLMLLAAVQGLRKPDSPGALT